MKKPALWPRNWHAWMAIALALPMLIVAITGIFFAHGNALGTRSIYVQADWLPGYGGGAANPRADIRSVVADSNGWLLGTRDGLVQIDNGVATTAGLAGEEVRNLAQTPQGLLATTGKGLWLRTDGNWTQILKGTITQAGGDAERLVATVRGQGPMFSTDGGNNWQPLKAQLDSALQQLPPSTAPNTITLATLIHDLHTGHALVGEEAEWLWSDILAVTLMFLAGTGIYMWWSRRRRKAARA